MYFLCLKIQRMPVPAGDDPDASLDLFLDHVTATLLNDVQRATFAEYAVGLLSDAERKSMEPLAAQSRPDAPGAAHKAFVYFTSTARWDDRAVRRHDGDELCARCRASRAWHGRIVRAVSGS